MKALLIFMILLTISNSATIPQCSSISTDFTSVTGYSIEKAKSRAQVFSTSYASSQVVNMVMDSDQKIYGLVIGSLPTSHTNLVTTWGLVAYAQDLTTLLWKYGSSTQVYLDTLAMNSANTGLLLADKNLNDVRIHLVNSTSGVFQVSRKIQYQTDQTYLHHMVVLGDTLYILADFDGGKMVIITVKDDLNSGLGIIDTDFDAAGEYTKLGISPDGYCLVMVWVKSNKIVVYQENLPLTVGQATLFNEELKYTLGWAITEARFYHVAITFNVNTKHLMVCHQGKDGDDDTQGILCSRYQYDNISQGHAQAGTSVQYNPLTGNPQARGIASYLNGVRIFGQINSADGFEAEWDETNCRVISSNTNFNTFQSTSRVNSLQIVDQATYSAGKASNNRAFIMRYPILRGFHHMQAGPSFPGSDNLQLQQNTAYQQNGIGDMGNGAGGKTLKVSSVTIYWSALVAATVQSGMNDTGFSVTSVYSTADDVIPTYYTTSIQQVEVEKVASVTLPHVICSESGSTLDAYSYQVFDYPTATNVLGSIPTWMTHSSNQFLTIGGTPPPALTGTTMRLAVKASSNESVGVYPLVYQREYVINFFHTCHDSNCATCTTNTSHPQWCTACADPATYQITTGQCTLIPVQVPTPAPVVVKEVEYIAPTQVKQASTTTQVLSSGGVTAGILASMSSPQALLVIMNQFQLVLVLPLLNIDMANDLKQYILSFEYAKLSLDFLPFDPTFGFIGVLNSYFKMEQVNNSLKDLGYESGSLFINQFQFFLMLGLSFLVAGVVLVVWLAVRRGKQSCLRRTMKKVFDFFFLSIYIRTFLETYIFFLLLIIQELIECDLSGVANIISYSFTGVCAVFIIGSTVFIIIHYMKYHNKPRVTEGVFGSIYSDLKPGTYSQLTNLIFMLRRILIAVIVIGLGKQFNPTPWVQLVLYSCLQLTNLLMLIAIRPYSAFRDNFLNILNEIFYMSFCILCGRFLSGPNSFFGYLIIYLITANTCMISVIIMFLLLHDSINQFVKKFKSKMVKKVEQDIDVEVEEEVVVEEAEVNLEEEELDFGFEDPYMFNSMHSNDVKLYDQQSSSSRYLQNYMDASIEHINSPRSEIGTFANTSMISQNQSPPSQTPSIYDRPTRAINIFINPSLLSRPMKRITSSKMKILKLTVLIDICFQYNSLMVLFKWELMGMVVI